MSNNLFLTDFFRNSAPYTIIFTKDVTAKYPTQVLLSIFKTYLRGVTCPNTIPFNLKKKMIVVDSIFSRDKLYKKLYIYMNPRILQKKKKPIKLKKVKIQRFGFSRL